jgi:D-alanyl-D-alanine carboxypeptidase (penicillin-binding protein 5/6)
MKISKIWKNTAWTLLLMTININVCAAQEPEITAKAAIVMEAKTGKVLYAKDAETRRYPASTTKMMTLIVALEKGNLKDVVTASQEASETEGSTMFLENGERLQLIDMLYGIMLVSGNDATVAVAEHIAGSVADYARLMTEKAHEIGAKDTNFVNSSGLPDPNHYTTAHDLARIAAYGFKNPMFAKIVGSKERVTPWQGKDYGRELQNENRMLWLYDGANGVKTGYTNAAGRCLVSAAKRNDIQLIAVVLDSEYMWNDSIALLNYGFENIGMKTFLRKGELGRSINVESGKKKTVKLQIDENLAAPVADGEKKEFETVIDVPDKIAAPVYKGQKIGKAKLLYKGEAISETELKAAEDVEIKSFFRTVTGFFSSIFTDIAAMFR